MTKDDVKISNSIIKFLNKRMCELDRQGRDQADFIFMTDRVTVHSILSASASFSVQNKVYAEDEMLKAFKINGFEGRVICDEGIGYFLADMKDVA